MGFFRKTTVTIVATKTINQAIEFAGYSNTDTLGGAVFGFASLSSQEQFDFLEQYRSYLTKTEEPKNLKRSVATTSRITNMISSIELHKVRTNMKIATIVFWFSELSPKEKTEAVVNYLEKYEKLGEEKPLDENISTQSRG